MQQLSECRVIIQTDGGAIDVEELTAFLYRFRAIYAAALDISQAQRNNMEANALAQAVKQRIYGIDWRWLSRFAHKDLGEYNLGILDIRRENPLSIVFEGAIVALTAAVILSGGRISFLKGAVDANLQPLGIGIQHLRDAFGEKPLKQKKTKKTYSTKKSKRK